MLLTTNKMKKIIFLMLSCAIVASMSAQTVTKNEMPKSLQGVRMNVQMDFSNAVILGMSEEEFAKYEKDWNGDKPAIVRNFRNGANIAIGKSMGIGEYKNAPYTIKADVNTITDKGYIICDVDIIDTNGKVLLHIDDLNGGNEPTMGIGTKLSRIKMWATLMGKKLGKILKAELK